MSGGAEHTMTRPGRFTQKDVQKACKAVQDSGLQVSKVVVTDGSIEVIIARPGDHENDSAVDKDRRELRKRLNAKD